MKKLRVSTPHGNTVFCDDIRAEVSGKLILIGVYQGAMVLPADTEFPVQTPGLGFFFKYVERPGESDEPVKLQVFMPQDNEPLFTTAIDPGPTRHDIPARPSHISEEDFDPVNVFQGSANVSPLILSGPGMIQVRAVRGEEYISIGTLSVQVEGAGPAVIQLEAEASPGGNLDLPS